MHKNIYLLIAIIVVVGFVFYLFYMNKNSSISGSSDSSIPDSSDYVVFSSDYDPHIIAGIDLSKRFTPSDVDIQQAFLLEEKKIGSSSKIRPLKNYKTQFFGYINQNKEKIIWAFHFCKESEKLFPNWKTTMFNISDGGNCFFDVKINLTTGKTFDFSVNGQA